MTRDHRPLLDAAEDELVELARGKNEDAFAELMHRNTSVSFRLALSVLKNRQEAEDEVQTSFLKAWKSLETFQGASRFSTWLRSIVFNQSLMRLRSLRRATMESIDERQAGERQRELPGPEPSPEAILGKSELHSRLNAEIRALPTILREVIVLRDIENLSSELAAARLGLSEPALKSRLLRARAMLRDRMERHVTRHSLVI